MPGLVDRLLRLDAQIETIAEDFVDKQHALMDAYAKTRDDRGAQLARWLDVSEKKGFMFPAPNIDAKKALFAGLRAIAGPVKPRKAAKK